MSFDMPDILFHSDLNIPRGVHSGLSATAHQQCSTIYR